MKRGQLNPIQRAAVKQERQRWRAERHEAATEIVCNMLLPGADPWETAQGIIHVLAELGYLA